MATDHNACPVSDNTLAASLASLEVGVAYENRFGDMVVSQVVNEIGVLAESAITCGRHVFVRTNRMYVDGVNLQRGLYVCTGTCQYHTVDGNMATVYVLDEMGQELADKRLAAIHEEKMKEEVKRRQIEEQQRFEEEKRAIEKHARQMEKERELQRLKEENDRKLAAIRAKTEMELEKRRQEEARKAEEERKKRFPIEQKQRAEYAEIKLVPISFRADSYFEMQQDLKKYVYSVCVTDKKWSELKKLQADKNWLGMLAAISEGEMPQYPEEKVIDELIDRLRKETFHVEILFTHTIDFSPGIEVTHWSNLGSRGSPYFELSKTVVRSTRGMVRFNRSASWSSVDARLVAEFCIEGGKDGIVYCAQSAQKEDPYEDDALFYKLDKQARVAIEKIENDQKLHFLGWMVIHFWGKEIKKDLDGCVRVIEEAIFENMIESATLDEPVEYHSRK